jgi:tetratricopeptide (TPR) repeat protein
MQNHRNKTARAAIQPQPFWTRIRAIALFPLQGAAFWSLLTLTLCSLLSFLPLVSIIIALAAYRYAFEILRHTANGHDGAPDYGLDLSDGAVWRAFILFLLSVLAVGLAGWLTGNKSIALLVLIAVAFFMPGSVISLAMDGGLFRALNPLVPLGMVTRIGWPYLAAFGLLLVILFSSLTASAWLGHFLPPLVSSLAVNFVTTWGLFSVFYLLGYLVYQYHEALGFAPEALALDMQRHDPDQTLLDEAEALIRNGHNNDALGVLRGAVRSRAVSLAVHELYQRLLRQSTCSDELREHSRHYISRLIAEKQERGALAVLREALQQDANFVPLQPEQAMLLIERAHSSGQHQLVADALRAMLRAWPRAEQASQWSLELALLLSDRFGRDEEARALLADALQRCTDEEQRRRLQVALSALEKLK